MKRGAKAPLFLKLKIMKKLIAKGNTYKRLKEGVHVVTIESIDYKVINDVIQTDENNNPIVEIVFKDKDNYKIKKDIVLNNYSKDIFKRIANATRTIWKDKFDITTLEKKKLKIVVQKVYLTEGGKKTKDLSGNYNFYYSVKNLFFKENDDVPDNISLEFIKEIGSPLQ